MKLAVINCFGDGPLPDLQMEPNEMTFLDVYTLVPISLFLVFIYVRHKYITKRA